ncbi:MAG: DUF4105 domain-containing protein [Muribaculaceae bacterium]|nr:DUF4105 domain-containing protein [Muribaculaceae bacterium]
MRLRPKYVLGLIAAFLSTITMHAAPQVPPAPEIAGDSIRVSLITFAPGADTYELFGHSELRVISRDLATPSNPCGDWFINYGVFDFTTPGFFWRFARGESDYLCMAVPPHLVAVDNEGRKMTEQVLDLSHDEARALRDYVVWNSQPENREYRYRYFSDNCATRPRDIIERAVGDSLRYGDSLMGQVTFRDVMSHYTANYPWEQFGIDMILGAPCDTIINVRQQMFVPMLLAQAMATATRDSNGKQTTLVNETNVLLDGPEEGTVLPPTPWYLSPMAAMLVVLVITLAMCWRDWRRRRLTRWFDTLFYVALAVMGGVVCFVAFFSSHEATWPNYNVLWLNPLWLALAILVRRDKWSRARRYVALALTALTLTTMAVWLARLQVPNAAFWPLAVATLARTITTYKL